MAIKLDLTKFKHIKSDAKSTTLQHKDGHMLTIAHGPLSKESQQQLAGLSKIAQDAQTPLQQDETKHKMADGDTIMAKNAAEGIKKANNSTERPHGATIHVPGKEHPQGYGKVKMMYEGGKTESSTWDTIKNNVLHSMDEPKPVPKPTPVRPPMETDPKGTKGISDYFNSEKYAEGGEVEMDAQGGNAGEERKKLFGTTSQPSAGSAKREAQIAQLQKFAKEHLGMELVPSGGKIDAATGKRRSAEAEEGVDKPDWRSGKLEAQWNPDAITHEIAHAMLLPEGVGLEEGQAHMDKQYGDVQKKYGYMKQKRSQGEVQPMGAEQLIRRASGLPANTSSVPVKPGEGPRTSVEDPNVVIGTRVKAGKDNSKEVDLIRQSRNLSPENRQRVLDILDKKVVFDKAKGWIPNMEHMGAKVAAYKKSKGMMADGGEVPHYAHGTTNVSETPPDAPIEQAPTADQMTQALAPTATVTEGEPNIKIKPKERTGPANFSQETDPVLARKRELYNLMVSGNPAKHPTTTGEGSQTFGPNGEPPANLDPQDWQNADTAYAQEQAANAAKATEQQQKVIQQNQARADAGMLLLPVPNVPQGPQVPGSPENPPAPQPNEIPQQAQKQVDIGAQGINDTLGMMQTGYQNKLAGIEQQGAATGQLGQQQAQILDQQAQAQQEAKISYKNNYDQLEQERQAHMADIQNGYIDPNQYWTGDKNGNGSHSKIATAIGMIIAGFDPAGTGNTAVKFLQHQMEMNIEAQKHNLGAKQNLLNANLRQFGNLKDATDMTRLMQHDVMQNELSQAAAKAQTPMAAAAVQQAKGDLRMTYAPIAQNITMRRAMMQLANEGSNGDPSNTAAAEQMISYARVVNPEMAKEMESRLIPGVGMSKVPVPQEARSQIISMQRLDTAAKDLLTYSKTHSNLIPGSAEYNHGVSKALAVQQLVRDGMLGTVFRESEKPLLDKFIKENPAGAFKALTTQPQLKAILETNSMNLNTTKQGYGLPTIKAAPEPVKVNGVMYMPDAHGGLHKIKTPTK